MNPVQEVPTEAIQVPELRITSDVEDHIMEELRDSIKAQGIRQPLQVAKVGDTYILEDGLHRLLVARDLGLPTVPAIVHQATEQDVMLQNLLLNRQRGKTNPAHEAKVVRYLLEESKLPRQEVARLTGISESWVRRLEILSQLPSKVIDLVEQGSLPVSHALALVPLDDPDQALQVARDAIAWRYNEEQVRIRVRDILGAQREPRPGEVVFDTAGKPTIIPLRCQSCHVELEGKEYVWLCPDCQELIFAFLERYRQPVAPTKTSSPTPQPPGKMVLTDKGWVQGPR